jgi:hypothetical protein
MDNGQHGRHANERCDQAFMSVGPHNRLCDVCHGALAAASTPEEEHSVAFLRISSTGLGLGSDGGPAAVRARGSL